MSVQNVSFFPYQNYIQRTGLSQKTTPATISPSQQPLPADTTIEKVDDYTKTIENIVPKNSEQMRITKKYMTNPSFKNLMENKFFNGNSERINGLVNIIYKLGKESEDTRKEVNTPGYFSPSLPDAKALYANIDVNNCIKNLDKLFASKFSDDLKEYMLFDNNNLTDLWYVNTTLEYLKPDSTSVKDLTQKYYMI